MNKKEGAGPWTRDEDAVLLDAYSEVGNKWTCISRMLPGRTDNAVKNRHALLQRKRAGLREGSGTTGKRSKAEAAAALPCGPYEDDMRYIPAHYNYVHPSDFYSGMASAPVGPDLSTYQQAANLQLLSAYHMQSLNPSIQFSHHSMQHMHASFPPPLFQGTPPHMKPEHASDMSSQYAAPPSSMYGYYPGSLAPPDNLYGILGLVGNQAPHSHPLGLGMAPGHGPPVATDGSCTPNSAYTVTGHPSFLHQSSDFQATQDTDVTAQRASSDSYPQYSIPDN